VNPAAASARTPAAAGFAAAGPAPGGSATAWATTALLAGLLSLYAPTYRDLATTYWQWDELKHGPLIALVAAWLFWRRRADIMRAGAAPRTGPGILLLAVGLALYVVGRSQQIPLLEAGSQIPVLAGILLLASGAHALRAAWFPLLFLAFLVPLPGIVTNEVTGALKEWVSAVVEEILYRAGLPVARSGVVLTLGQYRLLMADACSGLHSMFALSALGLLYLHLTGRASALHNALMITAILPIAFVANAFRVLVLALVTYYAGEAAGQGFAHDLAGVLLFAVALCSLFALDSLLRRFLADSPPAPAAKA
jgi:exosortase B